MKLYTLFTIIIWFGATASIAGIKDRLRFKTSNGRIVGVSKGVITLDNVMIYKLDDGEILYDNAANKLVEDHGSVFLFLAIDGRPNLDKMDVIRIESPKAKLIATAILSPIKDYDHDGYLEFGGRDLIEAYLNADSMYYIPTAYYKIKNGSVFLDKQLTRIKDIELNGVYLAPRRQLDKDGYCCRVIRKPRFIRREKK